MSHRRAAHRVDRVEGFRPLSGKKFQFACHKGLSCFTECCADLNLVLTPYDILRMRRRLGLSAQDFVDGYAVPASQGAFVFPMLLLKMRDDEGRRCPFVTGHGCAIYEDRPGACRLYPIGRAAATGLAGGEERAFYFVVDEEHCLGFGEARAWTLDEWIEDQGVGPYNRMNGPWMEIVTSPKSREVPLDAKKLGMFCMTSYNLDRFREFVFETKFLEVFEIPQAVIGRLMTDDAELLKLGMKWLRFALYGEGTLVLR